MSYLSKLQTIKGNKKSAKRKGRGYGSGKGGHNIGFGTKGQKARQGRKPGIFFEGGQTSLYRRMPYLVGFKNHNQYKIYEISLVRLVKLYDLVIKSSKDAKTDIVNADQFKQYLKLDCDFIKILGNGNVDFALNLEGFWFTKIAKEKILKSGGKIL